MLQRAWTQSQGYSAECHRQERLDYATKNLKLEDFIISCGCHEFLPRKKKTCTKQIWQLLPYETYQGGGVKWLLHLFACFSHFEAGEYVQHIPYFLHWKIILAFPLSSLTWAEASDSYQNKANKSNSVKGTGRSALPSLKIFFFWSIEHSQSRTVFHLLSASAAFLSHWITISR